MLTVKVRFPTGEREVPAQRRDDTMLIPDAYERLDSGFVELEPVPMIGWEFRPVLGGGWIAFQTTVDREQWRSHG